MSKLIPDFGRRVDAKMLVFVAGHYQDVHQWNDGCHSQSLQDVFVGTGWYYSST